MPRGLARLLLLACSLLSLGETPAATPAVGTWSKSDTGEAVVLDISYDAYALYQSFYMEAFIASLAEHLAVPAYTIYVTDFERSTEDTTVIFFDTLLYGTSSSSSAVLLDEYLHVQARFLCVAHRHFAASDASAPSRCSAPKVAGLWLSAPPPALLLWPRCVPTASLWLGLSTTTSLHRRPGRRRPRPLSPPPSSAPGTAWMAARRLH